MPITKSAVKELRKAKKRAAANRAYLKKIKEALKRAQKAAKAKNAEEAQTAAKQAIKLLDKAASRHVIHKNKAARKKSRLLAAIKKTGQ